MARAVAYDGTSLQGSTFHVTETDWEDVAHREIHLERLGNTDGGKIVNESFGPRFITLRGVINGTTIDDLEANIETLKELLHRQQKNLDFAYANGTRRFNVTLTSLMLSRGVGQITFVLFEAKFVTAGAPFATLTDSSTVGFTGVGTNFGTYYGSFVSIGTRRPMPIIKATVNGGSGVSSITFTNQTTGGSITVTPAGGFTAGDVLLINTEDYTVTLNGIAVDYTGFFPDFVQGANDFKRVVASTWHSIDLKLIYRPLYL